MTHEGRVPETAPWTRSGKRSKAIGGCRHALLVEQSWSNKREK